MLDRVEAVGADADPSWFPDDGLVHLDLHTDLNSNGRRLALRPQESHRRLCRRSEWLGGAMITTWRWNRDDQLPNGRRLGREWLSELRTPVVGRD